MNVLQDMLTYIELTSAGLQKAAELNQVHNSSRQKAAGLIDPVTSALLEAELVAPEKTAAAKMYLGNHAETLTMLKSAADIIKDLKERLAETETTKQAGLGSGVSIDPGKGSYAPIGQVYSNNPKESDAVLRRLTQS